jgi:hypothetical protein
MHTNLAGTRKYEGKRPLGKSWLSGEILLKLIFKRNVRNVDWVNMHHCSGQWPDVLMEPKRLSA